MKTILIVDDDKKFQHLVVDGLKAYGSVTTRQITDLIVKSATNGEEAVSVLTRFKVDLVVCDIKGLATHGFALIAYMKQSEYRDIPVIVVTADTPEMKSRLDQMGVSDYLKKPFVLFELLEKMMGVLDESSKVLISDFTVPNFLKALNTEKKTCTVEVTSQQNVGYLHLENGKLIDAETNDLTGDNAVIEVLRWQNTELKVNGLSSNKRRIRSPINQLLIQAAQTKDKKADVDSTPDPVFDEIITLAEGHHYKEARKRLTALLKENPRNHKGWLWYSRITDKITWIEKSLNNARKIASKDLEVLEEIKKFELAKKVLRGEQFSRCPFCWAPLNGKRLECPYCRAYLFIDDQLLTRSEAAKREPLQQAIDKYTRVVTKETNGDAHYYLSIAYLNLGQWEKGLYQLNNTVESFPEKKFYADQLQTLMGLLTSSNDVYVQETVEKQIGSDLTPTAVDETGKKRILVVENSPAVRKAISITLSKRGHEVIEAQDGLEAINCLDKTRPDVILMDTMLPKLDAQRVLAIIQENSGLKDIPVIVLTNKDGFLSRVKRKLSRSTAYLPKPFDLSELIETTENYLQ
jgi:twitching motility two-component system response regulator PilG